MTTAPLTLYRRHSSACAGKFHERPNPQEFTKCQCPIYCYGYVEGAEVRRSMKTRDWKRAEDQIAREGASIVSQVTTRTIEEVRDSFIAEAGARHLAERTIMNYLQVLNLVLKWYGPARPISVIDFPSLSRFRQEVRKRNGQPLSPRGSIKIVKIMRLFCGFCLDHGYLKGDNPAKKLKPPKDTGVVTRPFEPEEVGKMLAATQTPRERALILTLLYTGLRISDTYMLRRDRIDFATGALILTTQKTRAKTYIKVHPDLIEALQALPRGIGDWFFWDGTGNLHTRTQRSRREVMKVLNRSGVKGHPHMFRDTFAVELLKNGEDIRTVQLLLGHTSVQTTERHYAPWVKSFQTRLDTAVTRLNFSRTAPSEPAQPETPESESSDIRAA